MNLHSIWISYITGFWGTTCRNPSPIWMMFYLRQSCTYFLACAFFPSCNVSLRAWIQLSDSSRKRCPIWLPYGHCFWWLNCVLRVSTSVLGSLARSSHLFWAFPTVPMWQSPGLHSCVILPMNYSPVMWSWWVDLSRSFLGHTDIRSRFAGPCTLKSFKRFKGSFWHCLTAAWISSHCTTISSPPLGRFSDTFVERVALFRVSVCWRFSPRMVTCMSSPSCLCRCSPAALLPWASVWQNSVCFSC